MLLGRACRAHWHRLRSPALGRAISSAKLPATPPASSSVRSPSARAALESQLLSKLAEVLDPSLVSVSGLVVRPSGHVACTLDFYSGATPDRAALEAAAAAALRAAVPADVAAEEDGVIVASRVSRPRSFMGAKAPPSLQHVGALVGISSCKGGVGKSTVAANLAVALAEMGGRVGLLDADVHGPSLPSLVALPEGSLPLLQKAETRLLQPAQIGGVRLMSYGFIAKGASSGKVAAAVMRGPMVGKVVQQMLSGTEWGELDYLLVDLPPGTGDVQLTLCQTYGLTAAVVVTTPQRLARVDVEKGIDMFRELNVPICGVVENMAYFTDPSGQTHHPFGRTQLDQVREYAGVAAERATRLPIEEAVSDACDEGVPLVLARPQSEAAQQLRAAATNLVIAIAELQRPAGGRGVGAAAAAGAGGGASLLFDPKRGIVMRMLAGDDEGREFVLGAEAIKQLPGAPSLTSEPPSSPAAAAAAAQRVPVVGLAMGVEEEEGGAPEEGAPPAVVVKWQGGGETRVPLEEFKRRCGA